MYLGGRERGVSAGDSRGPFSQVPQLPVASGLGNLTRDPCARICPQWVDPVGAFCPTAELAGRSDISDAGCGSFNSLLLSFNSFTPALLFSFSIGSPGSEIQLKETHIEERRFALITKWVSWEMCGCVQKVLPLARIVQVAPKSPRESAPPQSSHFLKPGMPWSSHC